MMRRFLGCLCLLLSLSACQGEDEVQPAGEAPLSLQPVFTPLSFQAPVLLLQAPGNDEDFFLLEQDGRVLRFNQNSRRAQTALDIRSRVSSGGEKGLLGMAFHPDFASNGQIYLSYTTDIDGQLTSIISRFQADEQRRHIQTDSEQILLSVSQPYGNHNGGHIAFGPDGLLYIGLGDGGWAGDPRGHGQNTDTLLGSLLRIDVDQGQPYAIPADNPFSQSGGRPEIYAWGLRNPWRWSFDRQNGALWLADVGQDRYEEINRVTKGGNYGWNILEGRHCYEASVCDSEAYQSPLHEYSHDLGQSVTGGYVYRGRQIPGLGGRYLFADFVSGRIWSWHDGQAEELLNSALNISSFAQDHAGELYVLAYVEGKVYKLAP